MNAPRLRPPSLIESFNYAFQGIIHVLRTQRNMRIHFLFAIAVLIAALVTGVRKIELVALLLAIFIRTSARSRPRAWCRSSSAAKNSDRSRNHS